MSENGGLFPFIRTGTASDETPETKHLRDNSRYLIQNGLPSAISAAAVYLRGFVMNLLVVAPILISTSMILIWMHEFLCWLKCGAIPPGSFRTLACFTFYPAALSMLLGLALLTVWVGYAILVSVHRTGELRKRQLLAWWAAVLLSAVVLLSLVELHVWLIDVPFMSGIAWLQGAVAPLSAVAIGALPFLERLGSLATKGTEDAGWSDFLKRIVSWLILMLVAAVLPVALWLTAMLLAKTGMLWYRIDPLCISVTAIAAATTLFASWQLLSVNANSLHQLYRDRLGSAFLMRRRREGERVDEKQKVVRRYKMEAGTAAQRDVELVSADDFRLSDIKPECTPYHLINAALNVPGSKFANLRGRNADFFVFSARFLGSELTDYVDTAAAETILDRLNIGTAMAVSGAAVAPNMGMASLKPLSPTIAFFNIRLGRWLQHPHWIADCADRGRLGSYRGWRFRYPRPRYLLREAISKSGVNLWRTKAEDIRPKGFLFLTDGGHIENLGVYELLRRRCKVIIAVDAEADPGMTCRSLVRLERLARIDLNTRITIDWQPIGQRTREVSELVKSRKVSYAAGPHIALGLIEYPQPRGGGAREKGLLIYIKASLSGDENDYVLSYKAEYPSFPHETTADQIFSEEQLEVYRALGEHITKRFLTDSDVDRDSVSVFAGNDRKEIETLARGFLPADTKLKFLEQVAQMPTGNARAVHPRTSALRFRLLRQSWTQPRRRSQ
jgi:hypothetical protein